MWRRAALALAGSAALIGAWALFWPDPRCADPSCADRRFRVAVELDELQGTEPLPLEVEGADGTLSVRELLAGGGVELDVRRRGAPLPYDPAAGALDEADLHAYARAWAARGGPDARRGRIYALSAPALRGPDGVLMFGVLFDSEGRGGVAVSPTLTRRLFSLHHRELVPMLQMRTFAHELLHALNRHHADAAQSADRRLTVEAPTHCLSQVGSGAWRLREQPLWALSPTTIRYFQAAEPRDVLPGPGNSPFDARRGNARACELARSRPLQARESRWHLARERLSRLVGLADAAEPAPDAGAPAAGSAVQLRLEAQRAPYPLGFPVVLRLHATNVGTIPVRLVGRLSPRYGTVTIEVRRAGDPAWTPFEPLSLLEPADDPRTMLPGGEHTAESIEIYFGQQGWTFPAAGRYEVRARLRGDAALGNSVSEPLVLEVAAPRTAADVAALRPLLGAADALDPAVGLYFSMHGRIRDEAVRERLAGVAKDGAATALGAAARLVLAAPSIRAPIDPATGRRPPPDLRAARSILERGCVDSGLVAVASGLLDDAGGAWPFRRAAPAGESPEARAWEGIRPPRQPTRLVYGDPALARAGDEVRFRWSSSTLDGRARTAVRRAARELRRQPERTVLVAGHADASGPCRLNLDLGLARANAVARELVRSGVPRRRIEVVSLGSLRPVDFATSRAAARNNRRVEIWTAPAAPDSGGARAAGVAARAP